MRYSRQEKMGEIGKKGQLRLSQSRVAIVGIGALGTVCAEILARAGIGHLILIDRDIVELSNLQRQSLFTQEDIGMPKALQAKAHIERINRDIDVKAYAVELDRTSIDLLESDLIVGCTDGMESRFMINDYALKNGIPWVFGSAERTIGYVFGIVPGHACLRCAFSPGSREKECDGTGVLGTTTHMIGTLLANEAIKRIIRTGYEEDSMVRLDVWKNDLSIIKVRRKEGCPACEGRYDFLKDPVPGRIKRLCGEGVFQIKGPKKDYRNLKEAILRMEGSIDLGTCVISKDITVFDDGRTLIKAEDERTAIEKLKRISTKGRGF